MDNRRAADELMRKAAIEGDGIAGAYFELESDAHSIPGGSYIVGTAYDERDEDEDDNQRPY